MTTIPNRVKGFTLIELLVVLAIAGTTMGLVGGLAVDSYRKFQLKSEQLMLASYVNQAGDWAFIYEQPLKIALQNNIFALHDLKGKKLTEMHFNYLAFDQLEIVVNQSGQYSFSQIFYTTSSGKKRLDING